MTKSLRSNNQTESITRCKKHCLKKGHVLSHCQSIFLFLLSLPFPRFSHPSSPSHFPPYLFLSLLPPSSLSLFSCDKVIMARDTNPDLLVGDEQQVSFRSAYTVVWSLAGESTCRHWRRGSCCEPADGSGYELTDHS